VAQAAHYAEKGFLPILGDIPGFVSCHLLDAGNDVLAVVAVAGEVLARATADRRRVLDRRRLALVEATTWTGTERRVVGERRAEAASWAAVG
jgi:hypothetical protein